MGVFKAGSGSSTLQRSPSTHMALRRMGSGGGGCASRVQEPGSLSHRMRYRVPLPTSHLVAAEDSGLLMVIKKLDDPEACP